MDFVVMCSRDAEGKCGSALVIPELCPRGAAELVNEERSVNEPTAAARVAAEAKLSGVTSYNNSSSKM